LALNADVREGFVFIDHSHAVKVSAVQRDGIAEFVINEHLAFADRSHGTDLAPRLAIRAALDFEAVAVVSAVVESVQRGRRTFLTGVEGHQGHRQRFVHSESDGRVGIRLYARCGNAVNVPVVPPPLPGNTHLPLDVLSDSDQLEEE
jgi:hypothetical protein